MKILILSVFIIVWFAAPIRAQEVTETPEQCQSEAQKWYDAINTDTTINISVSLAESPQADTNLITGAFLAIDQSIKQTEALKYPNCVERARQWYLDGVQSTERGYWAMLVQRDITTTASNIAVGSQQIGEFRGYLAALGVVLANPPNTTLFLK